ALCERLRSRFRLVLVDEFQDVDPAQFELLRLIAPPESRPRLVVVGDPDQSIYGFRGTVPRLLSHDFEATYGASTRHLAACRRCSQEVLDAGERLLAATQPGRSPRGLHAEGSHRRPAVVVAREGDPVDEAFFAAREIKRRRSHGEPASRARAGTGPAAQESGRSRDVRARGTRFAAIPLAVG